MYRGRSQLFRARSGSGRCPSRVSTAAMLFIRPFIARGIEHTRGQLYKADLTPRQRIAALAWNTRTQPSEGSSKLTA